MAQQGGAGNGSNTPISQMVQLRPREESIPSLAPVCGCHRDHITRGAAGGREGHCLRQGVDTDPGAPEESKGSSFTTPQGRVRGPMSSSRC